jgi:16S rRNA (guanine527-N7)-methyltransferase
MIYASSVKEFEQSLIANMGSFSLDLSTETVKRLGEYYSLLTRWNDRLHLVAPCTPEEFAVRHVLESLLLLRYLPAKATVVDIGSGGGLPIIPCLIARPDLEATLIESSQKKVVFLREALNRLGLRAVVLAQRFEDVSPPPVSFVTSRALDQFMQKLPALMKWAPPGSKLMLFGGEALGKKLKNFEEILIPLSDRRYLFLTTD